MVAAAREVVPPLDELAHEAAVAAFLASAPGRARERAERHHAVLTERQARQIVKRESTAGDVLDELLVVNAGLESLGLAPPDYQTRDVRQTLPALNLGRRVRTSAIDDDSMTY